MTWQERQRALFFGAPLAVLPALSFLPLFMAALIAPHPRVVVTVAVFSSTTLCQLLGTGLLAFAARISEIDLITFFGLAVWLTLMVIAAYTGLFFAAFAARM
jgi:hypothetical protein